MQQEIELVEEEYYYCRLHFDGSVIILQYYTSPDWLGDWARWWEAGVEFPVSREAFTLLGKVPAFEELQKVKETCQN